MACEGGCKCKKDQSETKTFVQIEQAEYEQLMADATFLSCLEEAGVDNWDGYDEARSNFREMCS